MKVSDIESVACVVLPKFYSGDLHPESACVLFCVLGTEISTYEGRATGFVSSPGVLVGKSKAKALHKEGYHVPPQPKVRAVTRDKPPKPIFFHDGRLVQKPTPLMALVIILWIPIGFILACLRIVAGSLLPMPLVYHAFWALSHHKGHPPPPAKKSTGQFGVLFVCSHRTLLDPIFLSTTLGPPIAAVTYSVCRLSEIISPIKTVRLSRDRATDASMIKKLLEEAFFSELTDQIVPVAMVNRMSLFHGTTARGWKGMDPFHSFMNPSPAYEVTFLSKLPHELTCSSGKASHEMANYIQRYRALAGNDGTVVEKSKLQANKAMGC
ncbi:hypothetical protein P3X46_003007 [Hevea brasiliensis]|uniref:Phospholipid/glycerol acyltransferase domain-containing protein n=1 Tax=Hevea brasiliensis TaxID=3981 RepID=A0ABQ9N7H2_HEVBR|nr:hypothetical protein P3X46_003007 [Hevea brasiliensis]